MTLFPEMIQSALAHSIMARAVESGAVEFGFANPRDYCYDRHGKVDDTPYGGEPGMLLRAEPVALAAESLRRGNLGPESLAIVLTAPTGAVFTQTIAREFSACEHVIFLCGHYEGIDHRIETQVATHVVSIGDYVLTNGELPALVMADAIVRLLPEVLGSADSLQADSHSAGLLSAPNYTRPEVWRGEPVPDVLLSGNHQAIAKWRREQALKQTRARRPDLLAKAPLTKSDLELLE